MRIAFCDDSMEQLDLIRSMVLQWNGRPADLAVSCYDNGDSLLQAHSANPFDIISTTIHC